jgi:hypothetical protein
VDIRLGNVGKPTGEAWCGTISVKQSDRVFLSDRKLE